MIFPGKIVMVDDVSRENGDFIAIFLANMVFFDVFSRENGD